MERKRKLPARAAARVELVSKKRNTTPPVDSSSKSRSQTPQTVGSGLGPSGGGSRGNSASGRNTPALEVQQPAQQFPPQQLLPKSIQPGKPLPTVEQPQPEDLSAKDFQSIAESGVLSESLLRSRQKWTDGLFEKYWTKPSKRKGVVEDPKNPPKEIMHKVGLVTITVEPHVFEATMYTVKDPRPEPSAPAERPYVQYGPPNGAMPPRPAPRPAPRSATPATPSASATVPSPATTSHPSAAVKAPEKGATPPENLGTKVKTEPGTEPSAQPAPLQTPSVAVPANTASRPSTAAAPSKPLTSPRGMESILSPPLASITPTGPSVPQQPTSTMAPRQQPAATNPSPALSIASITSPPPIAGSVTVATTPAASVPPPAPSRPAASNNSAPAQRPGADPIIVTLAEKASTDSSLRDLMKRVATGEAQKDELAHFQRIIDQITAEHKLKGGEQGPSADRLIVDGKSVKYYSDEVNSIVGIVLRSNPKQRGVDLKAPADSNPLIIALLRKALDDMETRDKIRRVSEGSPRFSDATDLKVTLDSLKATKVKEKAAAAPRATQSQPQSQPPASSPASGQALRSKGPPPPPPIKRDISHVVFEFAGGSGDRYLFPKFAILEPQNNGQQVIASFLLVRKGSTSEYGGDPTLDYYQPATVRIFAHSAKHLEALHKVVAPRDEVQRYMEDVMDNMTRSDLLLLAMRLPRDEKKEEPKNHASENVLALIGNSSGSGNGNGNGNGTTSRIHTPKIEPGLAPGGPAIIHQSTPTAVMWKATPPPLRPSPVVRKAVNAVGADNEGGYQNMIAKVAKKTEEVA